VNFQQELDLARRKAKQAVRDFVQGAATGNLECMAESFDALDYGECDGGGWACAMRAAGRLMSVPPATQEFFLSIYIQHGDHIRGEGDDLALINGLRVLLPKYNGPAMYLYRGESFRNRSRRTYGLSWSANADVARAFAETDMYRMAGGGSVLLETLSPPDAIICAPALLNDRYAENEFIVDRRRLLTVKVVDRFPSLSHDEFTKMRASKLTAA
jgi:hypothetical protein